MDDQRLKIESKMLSLKYILEHRDIIKSCVHAGKSLMKTKRFFLCLGQVSLRFEDEKIDIFDHERIPIHPGSFTYGFYLISLSKFETAWTEIFRPY